MAESPSSSIARAVKWCVSLQQEIQAAYVFGSAAKGRTRPGSDVDVAVLVDRRVRPARLLAYRLRLMAELGSALHRSDVDVVI